jgi:carboxypeptidase C (cathepsin A)
MLNVGKDPARPDAEIFHVAYTLKGTDPATRPVTFVFNGGPGAASIFLHLSAIGPKTIATVGDGSFPASPARLEDNPATWLDFTDLVFIDPIGTGYSRMLPGPDGQPGDPKPYYGVVGDLEVIGRFIRQWLTVNQRWGSPKALAGESYAGLRIAALSRLLAEQFEVNLNRVVLLSPALYTELGETTPYALVYPSMLLPTQAAIAAHHGLSTLKEDPAGIAAAEDFATNGYLTGLARLGGMDPDEQAAFYAQVGGLIGIDPAVVARDHGRVGAAAFAVQLLGAQGKVLDTYDGTQAADNPSPGKQDEPSTFARSLTVLPGVLLPPFMDYVAKDLGYVTDRPYVVFDLNVNLAWDYNSKLGGPEDLATALTQNTDLKALVVHGYHDLMTNYLLSRYLLEQSTQSPSARARLSFKTYPGGHMFYLRNQSRAQLAKDVRDFFATAP